MASRKERILIIRLGALGDLIFCFQSFREIRLAHPEAEIALLTRPAYVEFAQSLPFFDRVLVDTHPKFSIPEWLRLRRKIKAFAPTRVYDLQGKKRQTFLYALLGGPKGPAWSGAAPRCRYPRPRPPKADMHFTDFLSAQLRAAGVPSAPQTDLSWLDSDTGKFSLPASFIVVIPGCSPRAAYKRWPAHCYAEFVRRLQAQNIPCVAVGTRADRDAVDAVKKAAPDLIDLCGKTSLFELAGVLRRAAGVIGNDTGPLHLAAAVGAPTLALFSGRSNPSWSKPPGSKVAWRQSSDLKDLSVDEVFFAFAVLLQYAKNESR